eukprot:TRINITY_DN8903_c0_g1_i8.p1 TRINITY_DN8903_c0_g1~~TRINITY_DN8903_c0_g1_i8.p1  ORF type:complete len:411 (-),score=112.91 TRINITY_DN8903_c0_g1_i8:608-1777(-)
MKDSASHKRTAEGDSNAPGKSDNPSVQVSQQGYFTEKSKATSNASVPAISRVSSAPATVLSTASSSCGAANVTAASTMAANVPTAVTTSSYSSSGKLAAPVGIVPLAAKSATIPHNKHPAFRNVHKMGQTVTKSGTGDALISIQCTAPAPLPAPAGASTAGLAAVSIGYSSSLPPPTTMSAPPPPQTLTVNPDSQPVISSRPGGFGLPPPTSQKSASLPAATKAAANAQLAAAGNIARKLSLPVPVSGISQLSAVPGSIIRQPTPQTTQTAATLMSAAGGGGGGGGSIVPPQALISSSTAAVIAQHQQKSAVFALAQQQSANTAATMTALPLAPTAVATPLFFHQQQPPQHHQTIAKKSDGSLTASRPKLSLPKPVPAAIASPVKSNPN